MYFALVTTIMLIMSIDIVNEKEKELKIEKEIKEMERKAFDIMTWQNSKLIFIFLLFFFYLIIRHIE